MSGTKKEKMDRAVKQAIAQGNVELANEITANVMVGTTMLIVFVVLILCLVLNEVGVFTVDKVIMRVATAIAFVIQLPMTIINSKLVGVGKWLKWPLIISLTLVCAVMAAALGHNVTLVMVLPMLISTRYFDKKYTTQVALITAAAFTVACFVNAEIGVLNLNMVKDDLSGITIGDNLRESVEEAIDNNGNRPWSYILSMYVNDFLPRCLVFFLMSVTCRFVAGRGKDMIEVQKETSEKDARIETELGLATNIQANMLPRIFPAFPQRKEFDIYATMTPAKEVGGDFYDFFMIDDYHLCIVIADVSGKGVPAALFMVIAKTLIKDHSISVREPGAVFTEVNKLLCESNSENLFVTAFEGVLDLRTGEFDYVNAGHELPFIFTKDGKYKAKKMNPQFVLSGFEDMQYKAGSIQLEPGDKLFQYTDGVTEATNANNELYGMDRLEKVLNANTDKTPEELLPIVKKDIDEFVGIAPQFDDITMLSLVFKAKADEK